MSLSNLWDKYAETAGETVVKDLYQEAKTGFTNIIGNHPAELPPPRTIPTPTPIVESPIQVTLPEPQVNTNNGAGYHQQNHNYPHQNQSFQSYPTQQYQQQFQPLPGAYMPPPPPPRYKIDEEKLRQMAKWKATLNLKYVETASNFARNLLGGLAATNAMVEMVERADKKDASLKAEELEMIPTMRKAVEKRRAIERGKTKILSDDDMRQIYEELIFQDMWDKNERGELRLEDPNDFLRNYMILTGAEILESGKDVIIDKVSVVAGSIKNKFSGKKA